MNARTHKYGATPATDGAGTVYDSTLERDVALVLEALCRQGTIDAISRQHCFVLLDRIPGHRATKGRPRVATVRAITYYADFVVYRRHRQPASIAPQQGCLVIETKGYRTPTWAIKENLYRRKERTGEYPPLVVVRSVAEALRAVEEWAR